MNEDHAYYSPQWVTNNTCATDADCVGMEYCDLNWHNSVCACTMESDARGDGCFERGPLYAWAVTMSVFSALLYLLYLVQSARVLWIIRERTDGRLLASRQATPVFLVSLCGAFGIFPHVSRLVAHAAHMRYTAWSLVHYLCLFGAFWFGLLAVLVVTMRWIEIAGKTQSFGITQMNRVKKALLIYTAFFSVVYIALIVALFVPGIDAPLVRAGFLGWTILNIIVLIVLMTVGSQRLGHLLARSVAMKEGSLTGAGGARLQRGVTVGAKEVFKQARESVKSKRMSLARAWSGGGSQNKKAAAESSAEALTVEMYEMRQLKSIAWTARRVRAGLASYVVVPYLPHRFQLLTHARPHEHAAVALSAQEPYRLACACRCHMGSWLLLQKGAVSVVDPLIPLPSARRRRHVGGSEPQGGVTWAPAGREWGADRTLGFRFLVRCGRPPLGQGHPLAMMTASVGT